MSTLHDHDLPVIVGVDGSPAALHAVRWAAREAMSRKAPLRLVYAYLEITMHTPMTLPHNLTEVLAELGHGWLKDAADAAREAAPQLEVATELVHGDAAGTLITESKHAQLVVLGSRGLGGFTELLVGSIAIAVSSHGRSPVVVVRGEDIEGKPVVVGVDGSPTSEAAVAFAYAEADRLGVPLIAVHTWSDSVPPVAFTIMPPLIDWSEVQANEEEVLTERLAGWQEKYPGVAVRRVITCDRPAHSLISAARDAQLVVVGSRGRGCATGLLLGSTSQALLHHAPCPVAIVRAT